MLFISTSWWPPQDSVGPPDHSGASPGVLERLPEVECHPCPARGAKGPDRVAVSGRPPPPIRVGVGNPASDTVVAPKTK